MAIFKNNEIDLNQDTSNRVPFFTLKGHGNYKFVRFMYKSIDDIVWAVVHGNIMINNKPRNVDCIRTVNQTCPMCESGLKTSNKAYIELMEYEHNNGKLTGNKQYCIWERGVTFINELQSNVNRYVAHGTNLYDYLWEIERTDGKTPRDTVYRLRKADDNMAVYCPIKPEDFPSEPFNPIKTRLVVTKTAQDMQTYLETNEFPNPNASASSQCAPQQVPQAQPHYQQPTQYYPQPNQYNPTNASSAQPYVGQMTQAVNNMQTATLDQTYTQPNVPQGNPYSPQGMTQQYNPNQQQEQNFRRR